MNSWIPALESAAHSVAALYLGSLAVLLTLAAAAALLLRRNPDWNAATRCLVWSAVPAATALWFALALVPAPKLSTAAPLAEFRAPAPAPVAVLAASPALPHSNDAEDFIPAAGTPVVATPEAGRSLRLAWSIAAVLFALVWAGGALWRLGRLTADAIRLFRIKRSALPLPPALAALAAREIADAAPRRQVEVRHSETLETPAAAGLGQALVLLPAGIEDELSEEELAQVIRHELAHLERGDDWTQAASRVVEALLWPLPGLREVAREAELARESACDEWVLAAAPRPKTYARCLTKIAGLRLEAGAPLRLAHGMAMSSKPHLLRRVENILARRGAPASPRLAPGRAALVVIVTVLAVSGLQRAWAALPELERPSALKELLTVENDQVVIAGDVTDESGDPRALRELARKARDAARMLRDQTRGATDGLGQEIEESIREGLAEGMAALREGLAGARAGADGARAGVDGLRAGLDGLRFNFTSGEAAAPKRKITPELLSLLSRSAAEDADSGVRIESIQTLSRCEGNEVTDAILRALDAAKDDAVREAAVTALSRRQKDNTRVTGRLVEIAKSATVGAPVRDAAFRALARGGTDDSVRALGQIYDGAPAPVKESVIRSLGRIASKSKPASEKLTSIARDDADPKMRRKAIQQLSRGAGEDFDFSWMPAPPSAPRAPKAPVPPTPPSPNAAPVPPAAPAGSARITLPDSCEVRPASGAPVNFDHKTRLL